MKLFFSQNQFIWTNISLTLRTRSEIVLFLYHFSQDIHHFCWVLTRIILIYLFTCDNDAFDRPRPPFRGLCWHRNSGASTTYLCSWPRRRGKLFDSVYPWRTKSATCLYLFIEDDWLAEASALLIPVKYDWWLIEWPSQRIEMPLLPHHHLWRVK